MMKNRVHSGQEALAYLVDCTLATVCKMALRKSRPKGEFERQIAIAQTGIDWMREFGSPMNDSRAEDIERSFGGSVSKWANAYVESIK